MAEILKFPTQYPVNQWHIRRDIERLLSKLGWDMAHCMKAFTNGDADLWPTFDDYRLSIMNVWLQEEFMIAQCRRSQSPLQGAKVAASARRAVIVPFPTPPEALANIMARKKAETKEAKQCKSAAVISPAPVAVPANGSRKEAHRRAMIQKAQIKLRELYKILEGFNDDVYRHILQERWGVRSSTKMNNFQLHELLLHLSELERLASIVKSGKEKQNGTPSLLNHDPTGLGREGQMGKIKKMLEEKGKAEGSDVPWGYAVAILKKHTGGVVTRFDDATPENLGAVIAALFQDARRKGRRTR